MPLLLAFIAIPMIEIAIFIQVGGLIGLWPTLALVLLSAVAGSWLVRSQGARALQDLRRSFSELSDPTEPLAHGGMILLAGALLVTPGFFTDAMGLSLLVPQVRARVLTWLRRRVKMTQFEMGGETRQPAPPKGDNVIDGTFEDVTTGKKPTHTPSGWTRH
jgi:UPF0716 protein FxsA